MKINWMWVGIAAAVAAVAYFIWNGNAAPVAPATPLKGLGGRGQRGNQGVTVSPSEGYEAIVAPAYNAVEEEVTQAVKKNADEDYSPDEDLF